MIFKLKKHHSLIYIYSRIKYFIYENFTHKDFPWLTQKANYWLSKNLNKSMRGLEFGSGRSTLWFAKKTNFIYSIETNLYWFNKVKSNHKFLNQNNIKLYYCEEKLDKYLNFLNKFQDESFDYILIDGKFRDFTALNSIKKLKKNGYLIIDNINRYLPSFSKSPSSIRNNFQTSNEWIQFSIKVKNFPSLIFTNNITDTAIYIKK